MGTMQWWHWSLFVVGGIVCLYLLWDANMDVRRKREREEEERWEAEAKQAALREAIRVNSERSRQEMQSRLDGFRDVGESDTELRRRRTIAEMQRGREETRAQAGMRNTPHYDLYKKTTPITTARPAPKPTGYEYEARPQPRRDDDTDIIDVLAAGVAVAGLFADSQSCRAPAPEPAIESGGGGDYGGGGATGSWDDNSSSSTDTTETRND